MEEFAVGFAGSSSTRAFESDEEFDACLSERARLRAGQYWTPVAVAKRAAQLFRERGVTTVLDVGCGPGKFCLVAGHAERELALEGAEQRKDLVRTAGRLAQRLGVRNARFSAIDAVDMRWDRFQGFYFFNPFAENVFPEQTQFDQTVELSVRRFASDLIRVEHRLASTRVGSVIVTYHGLGGPIPSCFDPVHEEPAGSDQLRVWVKRRRRSEGWCWLDSTEKISRSPRVDVYGRLAALLR